MAVLDSACFITFLVAFFLVSSLGSAQEEVRCGKPPSWMNPGVPVTLVREPNPGPSTCEVSGYVQEKVWECKDRYCCETNCSCESKLYADSICPDLSNGTKLTCYVETIRLRFKKLQCCKGASLNKTTNNCIAPLPPTSVTPNITAAPVYMKIVHVPYPVFIWVPIGLLVLLLLGIILALLWCRKRKKKHVPPPSGLENPAFENHGYEVPMGGAVGPPPLPVKLPFGDDEKKLGVPDEEFGMAVGGELPPPYPEKEKKAMTEENYYEDIDELKKVKFTDEMSAEYVASSDVYPKQPPSYQEGGKDPPMYTERSIREGNPQGNRLSYSFADQDNLMNEAHEDLRN